MPHELSPSKRFLAEPAMRRSIEDFVRRRVPASDVEDIVQTVLVEALASTTRPQEEDELRRWLLGIARHKVVDHHRRRSREMASELPDVAVGPAPVEERSLAQWAEEQAGANRDARSTLEWMAREGEGEKLEAIAEEEKVPAARVRQRVSRMRRWMKERWLAELAAAAALAVLALVLWRLFHKDEPVAQPVPEPRPSSTDVAPEAPIDRARALRDKAYKDCDRAAWQECLDRLDEAKGLDPAGDSDPRVGAARTRANDALRNEGPVKQKDAPPPIPTASTSPAPPKSTSAPAPPKSTSAPAPTAPKKPILEKKPPEPKQQVKSTGKDAVDFQAPADQKKRSKTTFKK